MQTPHNTISDRLDDFARREDQAAPSPEETLEAWLKRPWPTISRKHTHDEADAAPAALELP